MFEISSQLDFGQLSSYIFIQLKYTIYRVPNYPLLSYVDVPTFISVSSLGIICHHFFTLIVRPAASRSTTSLVLVEVM